ncbi:hypothetical protein [Chitinophaga sp. RAB17]|uniref:hypothetical protein n=1 Tax=Chitinophaga sp. RAB17 TaxID=3233049 RepID=UPI003F93F0D5
MSKMNVSVNNRPVLMLEKQIISKADVSTIENMSASDKSGVRMADSSFPTIPTTWGASPAVSEA